MIVILSTTTVPVFGSATDLLSLLILFFFLLFLLGDALHQSPRLRRFKSDRD